MSGIKTMKQIDYENSEVWMTTKRIETLVDGIFAIAMTLLVLSLDVPQFNSPVTNTVMLNSLIGMAPQFFIYILSFLLLATFWRINHSQFNYIKKTDQNLLWINIFWLLFVALFPFSTNLVGNYSLTVTMIFFHTNLLIIGIFYNLNWSYAAKHNFIDENVDEEFIESRKRMNLLLPICALIAIGVSFIAPDYSPFVYLITFFVRRIHF